MQTIPIRASAASSVTKTFAGSTLAELLLLVEPQDPNFRGCRWRRGAPGRQ